MDRSGLKKTFLTQGLPVYDRLREAFWKVSRLFPSACGLTFLYSIAAWGQSPIKLPALLPAADKNHQIILNTPAGKDKRLTIDGKIQQQLEDFISKKGDPIAAVVLVDVATGSIIAMAQGRQPSQWGTDSHTALYPDFPAASLFKTVTMAAILEVGATSTEKVRNLTGGCAEVNPQGSWMRDDAGKYGAKFTLGHAFAISCNGFFAQMAVNYLGLNVLSFYAEKFGWDGGGVATDFLLQPSPHVPPLPNSSSIGMVGSYAAGFGRVGLSPVHAAWINLAIAHNGMSMPIRIFADTTTPLTGGAKGDRRLLSEENSIQLREFMHTTVISGVAKGGFRPKKYQKVRALAGGKTGSLTGKSPKGYTTWFSGMMPYYKPEVVVSAVVVNDQKWHIRGTQLAAEALWLWYQEHYHAREIPPMPKKIAKK